MRSKYILKKILFTTSKNTQEFVEQELIKSIYTNIIKVHNIKHLKIIAINR